GTPQAPLLTVLGSVYATNEPTENSDRMFLSMITNACAAIRDLGTLDLLGSHARRSWCSRCSQSADGCRTTRASSANAATGRE
ncbi:hypothetical protein MXD62_25485, partial [Frankia sp. Mgl5]|nr:hypothetical protein [Frankia sp. Mgl5]